MKEQVLTQERANSITNILNADPERTKSLTALGLDAAVGGFNDLGYDFTKEELIAYGNILKNNEVLSDDALVGVAGGVSGNMEEDAWKTIGAVFAGAFAIGREVGKGIGNVVNNITGN